MMSKLSFVRGVFFLSFLLMAGMDASSQNYLGYSKEYIIKAMKSQRKDLNGPFVYTTSDSSYISYISHDKQRIIFYLFEPMEVTKSGRKTKADICVKYMSKTLCPEHMRCPQMEQVIRSLESSFTPEGYNTWIDYSKKIPQEWVLVEEDHYFEVHVTEKKK